MTGGRRCPVDAGDEIGPLEAVSLMPGTAGEDVQEKKQPGKKGKPSSHHARLV